MRRYLIIVIMACSCCGLYAQTAPVMKKLTALRTARPPKIDGVLNDEEWVNAPIATDFIELRPNPGRVETKEKRTEIKLLYDDAAVYVYARMYDHPDSVLKELVTRDNVGNADFIGIVFDTFYDRINGNGFFVTAAGSQFDAKYSLGGNEDPNWNAVWESAVKIDDKGWTAEMRIPYSALRFSGKEIQNWGLNIVRMRRKTNQQSFWNNIDPKANGFINQSGVLEGLKNIKPPLRLSVSPYISSYINHYPVNTPGIKNTTSSFNGGMDLKYGINQSFTLDMTLVPDFGQVQSDNRILNLTPFEVKFNENRQFFTEGTELFNKGDLFYSRRIGSFPAYTRDISGEMKPGEKIVSEPQGSKLLNATKVSGRTAKGLGIGVFNAITNRMFTTVEDAQGVRRNVESQPLTNYNIIVFDQSLKNNSAITFLNTNVLRQGSDYDANVSAFVFNLNDKKNKYFVNGAAKMSYLSAMPGREEQTGTSYEVKAGKQSGTFTWNYLQVLADSKFNPSDLGFFTNNNFFNNGIYAGYNIYKPGRWYNQWQGWMNIMYSRRYLPSAYQSLDVFGGYYVQFKNFWSVEANLDWQAEGNDFYEPRSAGRVFKSPENYGISIYVNPNRTKPYNFGGNLAIRKRTLFNGLGYDAYLFQNFRLSDKVALGLDVSYQPRYNYAGWVAQNGTDIIFSRYNRQTVENSADAKYTFTNRMGMMVRVRHYWSGRRNQAFFLLNNAGHLQDYTGTAPVNTDRNYNVFNIDLVYTWQFAPGSELSVSYKDASEANDSFYTPKYFKNMDKILSGPQNNSISLKVLYYLDYLDLRKRKS